MVESIEELLGPAAEPCTPQATHGAAKRTHIIEKHDSDVKSDPDSESDSDGDF